ncbi:MAG: hypothetical protein L0Y54_00010 [Sporichthyaceae bacterium]|nr:hypothetical protein [Sporichthyaceae bacterium]
MRTVRSRLVAAGAALAMLGAVGLTVATANSAGAAWPVCYYSVKTDNVPVYSDSYPPPQLPIIYTMPQGDVFVNPSAIRYTAPDGTKWRNGYDEDIPGADYGWAKQSNLTLLYGIGPCT